MAGDCAYETHYVNDDTFGNKQLFGRNQELIVDGILDTAKGGSKSIKAVVSSPYFEIIDGVLYRKKLERGYIRYREVLDRNRQRSTIAAFHEEPPGKRHHTLDDTYRTVADNYWWEGMYFHIREYVSGCPQCQAQQRREEVRGEPRISRTLASHGNAVLRQLSCQQEAGLFCDITLKTGSRSFPAHRAVLAAVSEYFQEIFTEMDSEGQPNVDLTGFREESVLPLLEFSYTSTLSLSAADLAEVSALAQHFRMWPAVEACRALQSERGGAAPKPGAGALQGHAGALQGHARPADTSRAGALHAKRKRGWSLGGRDAVESREDLLTPAFDPSRDAPGGRGRDSHAPGSPVCRLKLLDFKSPSSKAKTPTQNLPGGTPLLQPPAGAPQGPLLACATPCRQRLGWPEPGAEQSEEEGQSPRALEKYRLLSTLGLQRRSLLPRPEELIGWRQKKRLRKPKVSSYALTVPRKPRAPALPNAPAPVSTALLQALIKTEPPQVLIKTEPPQVLIKTEPPDPISMEDMMMGLGGAWGGGGGLERRELRRSARGRTAPPWTPVPSVAPPVSRRSLRVKQEPDAPPIWTLPPPTLSANPRPRGRPRKNPPPCVPGAPSGVRPRGRPRRGESPAPVLTLLTSIKEEPADASVTPAPLPTGRRQRQSKPPLKLLDPGFLFPLGRPGVSVKQEEAGVAAWQGAGLLGGRSGVARTRCSPRHARPGPGPDRTQPRAKGPPAPLLKNRAVHRRLMDRGATGGLTRPALLKAHKAKQTGQRPKNACAAPSLQRSAALESVRLARMKRLRERRSHTPVPSHTCLQCQAAYRSCDALIMHRIRHIEGKHWPCPLCSKTFFRQRNVQCHIRTHDPKLYKCSSCIASP
ncbi:proline-rich protein 36-like isoform X2 [Conger conger]|uniref:proline-rich protein 36-like isoform X2 n=1 Tax=Conger conger TaxID=82655 RepID=UPI002A5A45F6|nr:proline-rich protein 36-like isoform X2 [Conger conger]